MTFGQMANVLALTVGLAASCLAQVAKGPRTNVLDRKFTDELPRDPVAIPEALVAIFRWSETAAGIELKNCGRATQQVSLGGGTAREALNQMVMLRPDLEVAAAENGMVSVRNKDAGQLLDTVLSPMDVDYPESLTAVVRELLRNPEVIKAQDRLGLKEGPVRLGFSAMRKDGKRNEPVHLDAMTLRDALNRFAAISGRSVWIYEQSGCSDESFTLRFAVQ